MITIKGVDSKMIANNIEPAFATHPGTIIKEEIAAREISQKQLAEKMGVTASLLNEVLNGKRALNTEMALLIEAALDIPAEPLLSMQTEYNMITAKRDHKFMARLNEIRKISAVL
jgi:addiction module HigA family antidote